MPTESDLALAVTSDDGIVPAPSYVADVVSIYESMKDNPSMDARVPLESNANTPAPSIESHETRACYSVHKNKKAVRLLLELQFEFHVYHHLIDIF